MRWIAALLLAVPLAAVGSGASVTTAAAAQPQQILTVSAKGRSTYAKLTGWELRNGSWQVAIGPMDARIGYGGFSKLGIGQRQQGSGTTPVGTYDIRRGFGSKDNPGTALQWHKTDADDFWVYDRRDPASYNTLQTERAPGARWRTKGGWSEHLISYGKQYSYAAVIEFNTPPQPVNTSAGGGIFLHVNGPGATAGCVSVSKPGMKSILRWLRPGAEITMGPAKTVRSLTPFGGS